MTDTDKMHKAMKALTLALVAATAGRAQAAEAAPETGGESGLVVSALFGTEPPSYVHAAVANVLSFTLPSTKIVVHLTRTRPWRAAIGEFDTRTRRICIAGRTRGAIAQTGSARQLQATRPTAWSWRRQRFLPNSGRWQRCTRRAR